MFISCCYANQISGNLLFQWKIYLCLRSEIDGENIIIVVENKHINGLEINFECVIIIFNRRFSAFDVCCSPQSVLIHSNLHWALISTSGCNKR